MIVEISAVSNDPTVGRSHPALLRDVASRYQYKYKCKHKYKYKYKCKYNRWKGSALSNDPTVGRGHPALLREAQPVMKKILQFSLSF